MSEQFQKLPIDLQSFEIIREEGFLYVDKTRYIHQMLEDGPLLFHGASPALRQNPDGVGATQSIYREQGAF